MSIKTSTNCSSKLPETVSNKDFVTRSFLVDIHICHIFLRKTEISRQQLNFSIGNIA